MLLTDDQIKSMRDGYPPAGLDFWEAISLLSSHVDDLRHDLAVAEDALNMAWMYASKLPHQWPLPNRVKSKMKRALDSIRKTKEKRPVFGGLV